MLFASEVAGFGGAVYGRGGGSVQKRRYIGESVAVEQVAVEMCTIVAVVAVAVATGLESTTAAVAVGEVGFMATNASADLPHP